MVLGRSIGLLLTLLVPSQAWAQEAPVPVTFDTTDPDTSLRLPGPTAPDAEPCPPACTRNLSPGTYTVFLEGGSDSVKVLVRGPSHVLVSPASSFQRGIGWVLMLVGGSATGAAFWALYYDTNRRRDPTIDYKTPDWVYPVAIAGLLGAGVGVAGVIFFVMSGPSVEVLPPRTATAARKTVAQRSRFQFAPTLGKNGGGLRVGWAF